MSDASAVEVAVKSASYNIVLQVLMRILSSISNAIVLRFITKDALGIINVRFMLLYSTCQFFSREPFRRSCLSKLNNNNFKRKLNLLWLNIPVCFVCCSVMKYIWLNLLEQPDSNIVPYYLLGLQAVYYSVLIESFAEPVYVFSQSYYFVKLKVVAEGFSLTVKSILMIVFLWLWEGESMYAFAISQGVCSCIYTSTFYIYFWCFFRRNGKQSKSKLPISTVKEFFPDLLNFFVDWQDVYLTWCFFKQTLLKQLLTEGERFVMTFFSVMSFAEQGLYDVVSNLGSLSARFVFLPIEDSGYSLFSHLMSRDKKANSNQNITQCLLILERLSKLMLLLGLMILSFGYSYSQLLLLFYGGTFLSSSVAVTLMKWHCVYVLFMAVNGITEGFKFAVMDQHQLNMYNKNMIFLSCGFLFAAFCLAKIFGGVGFIVANCVNMGFRIAHSIYFITNYFNMSNFLFIKKLMPHPVVLGALVVSLCLTSVSEEYFCCDKGFQVWIWHLCIGVCFFMVFIAAVLFKETDVVKFIYEQFRRNKVDPKKDS